MHLEVTPLDMSQVYYLCKTSRTSKSKNYQSWYLTKVIDL